MDWSIEVGLIALGALIGYGFGQSSMDKVIQSYQDDLFELGERIKKLEMPAEGGE